jgi:hypothetical protein
MRYRNLQGYRRAVKVRIWYRDVSSHYITCTLDPSLHHWEKMLTLGVCWQHMELVCDSLTHAEYDMLSLMLGLAAEFVLRLDNSSQIRTSSLAPFISCALSFDIAIHHPHWFSPDSLRHCSWMIPG